MKGSLLRDRPRQWARKLLYFYRPLSAAGLFALGLLAGLLMALDGWRWLAGVALVSIALLVCCWYLFRPGRVRGGRSSLPGYSHRQFDQLAGSLPMGIWTASSEGRVDYINPFFAHYVGGDHEAATEVSDWLKALHPSDADHCAHAWRHSVERGSLFLKEYRLRRFDGAYRWHLARAVPLRDRNKNIQRWIGSAVDIHDRKVSEDRARDLSERLAGTLESITDSFFTLDKQWRFTYVNSEAERVLTRKRQELLQRELWQVFPDILGTDFETYYRRAVSEGHKVTFEAYYPPLHKWFSVNAYPSYEGLAVYFQDVTQRHRMEEQLRLLDACVTHMNDLVVITEALPQDEPGPRIVFVNPAFERRTGYRRDEVIGRSPRFLQGEETQRSELDRIRKAMRRWQPVRAELINYTKAGEPFWLEIELVPIVDSSGWYSHWLAVERDITERKKMEVERERVTALETAHKLAEVANKTKSEFLVTMSHEIRTPINGVIGMTDVLQQSLRDPGQQEMLSVISDSAQTLLGVVDDILDFSKLEAGKLRLEQRPFAPAGALHNVCRLLSEMARTKGVFINLFIDPAIPELVLGDELRVRQVVINLLSNAIKFTGGINRHAEVRVALFVEAADGKAMRVILQVRDNGIGMTEKTLSTLFSPFVQADVSTTRRYGGTGLGLTITRNLVELMGGDIKVSSAIDEGTEFRVTLPFLVEAQRPFIVAPVWRSAPVCRLLLPAVSSGAPSRGQDWLAYLRAAGITAELVTIDKDDPEPLRLSVSEEVWVVDESWGPWSEETLAQLSARVAAPRWVLIGRGRRRQPRLDDRGRVSLDADGLDPHALIEAVAIAAQELPAPERERTPAVSGSLPAKAEAREFEGRVLVAEDNATNRKVIAHQLALLGFSADLAPSGREALSLWREGKYAALLTDIHMPEMDGFELVERLQAQRDLTGLKVPIIAFSADQRAQARGDYREKGFDGFLVKPVTLVELERVFRALGVGASQAPVPVDLDTLRDIVGDEPGVVQEFLQSFGDNLAALEKQIAEAVRECDWAGVEWACHSLKSSARSVGARVLGDYCARLEQVAAETSEDDRAIAVKNVMTECQRVEQWVQATLNTDSDH
ncbi:PAS domain-containing protein [Marinimicrobium alkaliphilum]|uniref:PAS domain-containing protein n=1 Tax=Marinimicrobium alkaliphilum TaxID=2202654 RepID=UPI000DB9AFE8|nr:PAS domain-containing protein [Marinimicrobium alkaliphilum]